MSTTQSKIILARIDGSEHSADALVLARAPASAAEGDVVAAVVEPSQDFDPPC